MCDWSVAAPKSINATIGQKLVTAKFGGTSTGFRVDGGDKDTAICMRPGTEVAFTKDVRAFDINLGHTATFVQKNLDNPDTPHDYLEFHSGHVVNIGQLPIGLKATVLQLPAEPGDKPTKGKKDARIDGGTTLTARELMDVRN